MARPRKQIDPQQVEKLAAINCSYDEAAAVLGCSPDTIQRRFAAVFKKGRANGRSSLKRKMWEHAMGGNTTMMIWLSKQLLGYTDKVDQNIQATTNVVRKAQWKKSSNSTNLIPNNLSSTTQKPDTE